MSNFNAFKSSKAYNQMVSSFATLVQRADIVDKIVVVAKVRHLQPMNYPPVDIWIIVKGDCTMLIVKAARHAFLNPACF